MIDVEVAVVGSGFSGALLALALRRQGRTVALLERGKHPRFAIGESSTPLANLLLEEIADRYDLPRVRALSKWGTWQRTHPQVACGLKRGFTFLFHRLNEPFADTNEHDRQLMVAASPHDEIADTHWYRPDFDHFLVREAEAAGAVYLDEAHIHSLTPSPGGLTLDLVRHGQSTRVQAGFLVDASGPRGCLHRHFGLEEAPLRWLPRTEGLYSHFRDIDVWDRGEHSATPPYPPDAAALHHVFAGGWIWVLRFNNGITSAGAALRSPLAARIGVAEGAQGWSRLLDMFPSIRRQFAGARDVLPFVHSPALAFRSARVIGPRWALLPSAAGVIDPLLSTGFPLTLLGIVRLLEIFERTTGTDVDAEALRSYEADTIDELEMTERLVGALYASMDDPALFKRLSLLYFAAASFSEAARRLGKTHLAPGFLLHGNRHFAGRLRRCTELASLNPSGASRDELLAQIAAAVAPIDIAGFGNTRRRSWYPVDPNDFVENSSKLEATSGEIYALLERCGFAPSHQSSNASAGGPTMNSA